MIDDVLAELESVGTVESEGHFTLDRGKAREKMRKFQLADPRAYVLELVQAASLKGATRIRFDIDSRDMRMKFNGRPFTDEDFDDIYGAAFTRRLDHDVLARKQLALGVNSAMALRPSRITVESGDGKTGARLSLEPDEEDSFESVQTTVAGTVIHVRERFRLGTFVAFFKNLAGSLAEEQLLRERCRYATLVIDLENERLDRGLTLQLPPPEQPLVEAKVKVGHTMAAVALAKSREGAALVDLVKDGVYIATHRLPESPWPFPPGLRAVVQDHALRKDVSQSDIVRDDAYTEMLRVVEHAMRQAMVSLAELFREQKAPSWAEAELLEQMHYLAGRQLLLANKEHSGLAAALRRLVVWQTTAKEWLTLDDLYREVKQHGSLPYVRLHRYEGVLPPGRGFVLFFTGSLERDKRALQVLQAVFSDEMNEVSQQLELLRQRERARLAWRARPAEPILPAGSYLVRRPVQGPGFQGELGITAAPAGPAHVAFVVQGCLLSEHELQLPVTGLRMVLTGDMFEPTADYDAIAPNKHACAAVLRALEELPALYGDLAHHASAPWAQTCAMSFLVAALGEEPLARLCTQALSFPRTSHDAARKDVPHVALSLDLDRPEPHPVATMPLFATLGAKRYSLAELCERGRKDERITVVSQRVPGIEADILVLSEEQIDLLQPLFRREFEDGRKQVDRLVWRKEFMDEPEHSRSLEVTPGAVVVPIEGKGIEGELRVVPLVGFPLEQRSITVLHENRPLGEVTLLLAGHCTGWVQARRVLPWADYRGIKEGQGLDQVRAAILQAFAAAVLRIAQRAKSAMNPHDRAFLREAIALHFPTRPLRVAYDRIARTKSIPEQKKLALFRRLYCALQAAEDPEEFGRRLWRLGNSKTAAADAMAIDVPKRVNQWALTALDALFPPGDTSTDLAARAVRPVAALRELPLLQRHDQRHISLDDLLEATKHRPMVLYVDKPESFDLGERLALLVDETHLLQLRRMLGGNLLNGTGVMEQERNRRKREAQAPVERIALPPGRVLLSTAIPTDRNNASRRGELGLAREHPGAPGQAPTTTLVAHRKHRLVGELMVDHRPFHLLIAVNDNRFGLSSDGANIREDRTTRKLLEQCEPLVPAMVETLLARYGAMTPVERTATWYHALDLLVHERPAEPKGWAAPDLDPPLAATAKHPGFATLGGPRVSVADLAEARDAHEVIAASPPGGRPWSTPPYGPQRPVVVLDAYEHHALNAMLGPVKLDTLSTWEKRRRHWENKKAPQAEPPRSALVHLTLPGPRLQGWLSIPGQGDAPRIALCTHGRVVVARAFEGVMACEGAVWGPGVERNEIWNDASLTEDALEELRVAALGLHRELGQWYARVSMDSRREWVAGHLSALVVELRGVQRAEALQLDQAQLLDQLRTLPVLALRGGRRISLQTALQEQPDELGHLGLWDSYAQNVLSAFDDRDANPAPPAEAPEPPPLPDLPPPPPATPEEQLVDDIRAELSLVREHNHTLLSNVQLDRLVVQPLTGKHKALVALANERGVVINAHHPVVKRALAHRERDPLWQSWVSSAVYTAINVWLEEVTDRDEMHFLHLMAQLVAG